MSVAIIQRHFSCGCNRANEYLNKLLEIGIVKDNYGAQNETYIEDERPKKNEVV